MQLLLVSFLFAAGALAQNGCGFPDGPDCVSLGTGASGLEQFADDGCCLLPLRCGNIAGEICERVDVGNRNPQAGNQEQDQPADENNTEQEEDEPDNNANVDPNCGFPNGPDCVSLGKGGADGLEQFADDGCCLLPLRCGNIAGEICERVPAGARSLARLWKARRSEAH
ncbi:hypothetical protein NLU13_1239 [Sarocladium strictum]|uniref:Uncharacterized protein n=1 Tax=Sarocladium strictum TaxID=5046 RepID=A0AA39GQL5_SARSR|nr:hypothetical protein NLU13_1239 [Sarocladium strictum]